MIILSAGHDPVYWGAVNPRYRLVEHFSALIICDLVMDAFRQDKRVHMLNMDQHAPLFDRRLSSLNAKVNLINEMHAIEPVDLCVELHFNASQGHQAKGSEVLVYGNEKRVSKTAENYARLFRAPLEAFDGERDDRGIKHFSTLIFLQRTRPPAIILEPLFLDHEDDAQPLLTHVGRARIADAIIEGIRRALQEVG